MNAKSPTTGSTALHLASGIFNASECIVRMLLENGANIYETDILGRTPLHIACSQYGSESLVKLLIEFGGSKLINTTDKTGSSPLHSATR